MKEYYPGYYFDDSGRARVTLQINFSYPIGDGLKMVNGYMNSFEKLDSLLSKNNGFLKTSDAVAVGVSRTVLGDFARVRELERIAHGLYMSKDAWDDGMFVIQVRFSDFSTLILLS